MDRELARSEHPQAPGLTRRSLLQRAAGLGLAASTLGALELLAQLPEEALGRRQLGAPGNPVPDRKAPPQADQGRRRARPLRSRLHAVRHHRARAHAERRRPGHAGAGARAGGAGLPVQPERGVHDGGVRHPLLRRAPRRLLRVARRRAHAAPRRRTETPGAGRGGARTHRRQPRKPRDHEAALQHPRADREQRHAAHPAQQLERDPRRRTQLAHRSQHHPRRRGRRRLWAGRAAAGYLAPADVHGTGAPAGDRADGRAPVRGNGEPRVADVDGVRLPAGGQQRPAAGGDVPWQGRRQAHHRPPRRLLRPRLRSSTSRT